MNWFLFEVALEFQDAIAKADALAGYRAVHSPKDIARFSAYFTKRMERSVQERFALATDALLFHTEYVSDYYPNIPPAQGEALLDVAIKAWDDMLSVCEVCPERCVSEQNLPSTLFDSYRKDGLL
jgi:uncharacterized Fe-S radical SAM superfamily protein PflX